MKIKTDKDKMELGFALPEPGTYLFEIDEKIELYTNPNTEKISLKIPAKIVEAVEGETESIGLIVNHFAPVQTNYGEKQVCHLLTITDLAGHFESKFPDNTAFTDPAFVDELILRLPGKLFKGKVEIRENNKGGKNANFKYWERAGKANQPVTNAATESTGDDEEF